MNPTATLASVPVLTAPFNVSTYTSAGGVYNRDAGDTGSDWNIVRGGLDSQLSKSSGLGQLLWTAFTKPGDAAIYSSQGQLFNINWKSSDADPQLDDTNLQFTTTSGSINSSVSGQVDWGIYCTPTCNQDLRTFVFYGGTGSAGWNLNLSVGDNSHVPASIVLPASASFGVLGTFASRLPSTARIEVRYSGAGTSYLALQVIAMQIPVRSRLVPSTLTMLRRQGAMGALSA